MLCIGYAQSATDEGSFTAERTPHPPSLCSGTLSHKGRGGRALNPLELQSRQPCIEPVGGNQRGMGALLDDTAMVQHQDAVA